MKMKIELFSLLLFCSMPLFADYLNTTENAGALVVLDQSGSDLEPYYFLLSNKKNYLWYRTNKVYYSNTGCSEELPPFGEDCTGKLNALGAIAKDSEPYLLLQKENKGMENDGMVFVNYRGEDHRSWFWTNMECPSKNQSGKCRLLSGLGATSVRDYHGLQQRPYFFVTDSFSIFNLWQDKNKDWHWSDMGCPTDVCTNLAGIKAMSVYDSSSISERPYLFVIDNKTNKVWDLWWDTSANPPKWVWSNLGCPHDKCDEEKKKYLGVGGMMRTRLQNGIDIGEPRFPYVFLVEEGNSDEVHYLQWTDPKDGPQVWSWKKISLKNTDQIIGAVPVKDGDNIIPVIVSETKDSKIAITYLNKNQKWKTKLRKCNLCPHDNAVALSRTHTDKGGRGVILYEESVMGSVRKKRKFNTYRF